MKHRNLATLVLALTMLVTAVSGALAAPQPALAGTKQVGLVIAFPDGTKYTGIVTVPADATTFDALQQAKIELVSTVGQFGPSVCSINKTGCPATNCFCDKQHFWAFYHLDPASNKWTAAQEGVGAAKPANGAVEGFIWSGVDASFNPTDQPPVMSFAQIQAQSATAAASAGKPAAPVALPVTGGTAPFLWLAVAGAAILAAGIVLSVRRGKA